MKILNLLKILKTDDIKPTKNLKTDDIKSAENLNAEDIKPAENLNEKPETSKGVNEQDKIETKENLNEQGENTLKPDTLELGSSQGLFEDNLSKDSKIHNLDIEDVPEDFNTSIKKVEKISDDAQKEEKDEVSENSSEIGSESSVLSFIINRTMANVVIQLFQKLGLFNPEDNSEQVLKNELEETLLKILEAENAAKVTLKATIQPDQINQQQPQSNLEDKKSEEQTSKSTDASNEIKSEDKKPEDKKTEDSKSTDAIKKK